MKVILLFLAFLSAPAIVTSRLFYPDKFIFNVTAVCDVPKIREWCMSIYLFDVDSTSKDDPLLWAQSCSKNKTMHILVETILNRGDTDIFDYLEDEVAWQAYHSCTSVNAQNSVNQLSHCECSHSQGYINVKFKSFRGATYYNNLIYWPHDSYPITYGHCDLTEAFRYLGEEALPKARCSWNGKYDDRVLSWYPNFTKPALKKTVIDVLLS